MPAGTETAFQKLFPDNTSVRTPDLKIVNSLCKAQSENLSICRSYRIYGFYRRSVTLNHLYLAV